MWHVFAGPIEPAHGQIRSSFVPPAMIDALRNLVHAGKQLVCERKRRGSTKGCCDRNADCQRRPRAVPSRNHHSALQSATTAG